MRRPGTALLAEAGPILLLFGALVVKLLYFVKVVYPLPRRWSGARYFLEGVTLATLSSLGTLLLIAAPLFLLSRRPRFLAAWCLALAGSLLILADVLYLRFHQDILSISAMADAGQLGMVSESVIALLRPVDVLLFADLALGLALFPAYSRLVRARPERPGRRRWFAVGSAVAGAALTAIPVRQVLNAGPLSYMSHLKVRGAGRIGLFNYHAYELLRAQYVSATRRAPTRADSTRVRSFLESWEPRTVRPELFGVARGRNLIIVMAESLEGFVLGLRVDGREVTPNLNALARRSIAFDNFYTQAWRGVTSDGEFTSLNSIHPLPDGAVPTILPRQRFRALPHVMAEHGYRTMSAHGAPGAMWSVRSIHPRYGIERSYFLEDLKPGERIGMGLSDGAFFEQVVPLLAEQREPFAAFLISLSTHHPYTLPRQHARLRVGDFEGTRVGGYLQSVHYFDEVFGEFVRRLDSLGILDRSVLAVYGDHPANYGDQQTLGRLLARHAGYVPPRAGPDYRLWQADRRLAFLIHLPGGASAGVRSVPAGHLDVAPTLLSLFGIGDGHMVALGRDLLSAPTSSVVFRDGSFVRGDTLCVASGSPESASWCRDTRSGAEVPLPQQQANFTAARARLAVSDLILTGDLIPWAATIGRGGEAVAGPARGQPAVRTP